MHSAPPPGHAHSASPARRAAEFRPFSSARVRLDRARKQIDELNFDLAAFLKTEFFRASVEQHPKTRRNTVETVFIRNVPKAISCVIGDAIHNARVALDMVAAQMVREKIGYCPRHVRFPFHESKPELLAACARGELDKLGPKTLAVIADQIRPYRGGDDALYALHDLDILDRQFPVVPQISIVELRNMEFEDPTGTVNFKLTSLVDTFGHIQQPIVAAGGHLRMSRQGEPIFAVLFGRELPMAGQPIVPNLVRFTERVTHAIDALEAV
jgi:hypothetical protein